MSSDNSKSSSGRTAIIVALITLAGTLLTAVIYNWNSIFPNHASSADSSIASHQQPPSPETTKVNPPLIDSQIACTIEGTAYNQDQNNAPLATLDVGYFENNEFKFLTTTGPDGKFKAEFSFPKSHFPFQLYEGWQSHFKKQTQYTIYSTGRTDINLYVSPSSMEKQTPIIRPYLRVYKKISPTLIKAIPKDS